MDKARFDDREATQSNQRKISPTDLFNGAGRNPAPQGASCGGDKLRDSTLRRQKPLISNLIIIDDRPVIADFDDPIGDGLNEFVIM